LPPRSAATTCWRSFSPRPTPTRICRISIVPSFVGQLTCVVSCGGKTALHIAAEKASGRHWSFACSCTRASTPLAATTMTARHSTMSSRRSFVTPVVAATERKRDDLAQIRALLCTALGLPLDVSLPDAATVNEMRLADERSVRLRAKTARNAEQERQRLDGLQRIAQLYTPRHSDVPTGDCLQFVAGFDGSATTLDDAYPGLLTASVLTATCCRRILEEVEHYEAHALSNTLLPLHTRHDDNLGSLERYGFLPLLTALVDATVSKESRADCARQRAEARGGAARVCDSQLGRTDGRIREIQNASRQIGDHNQLVPGEDGGRARFAGAVLSPAPAGQEQPGDDRIGADAGASGWTSGDSHRTHWHRTVPIEAGERASMIVWADLT
jgi:hypothetical protein